ncbi:hypothetical protein Tco_1298039 [Tanacetum coccineum]
MPTPSSSPTPTPLNSFLPKPTPPKDLTPPRDESKVKGKYEAKRAKVLVEYNHYITFRVDQRQITKINYRIDRVTKDATMRIERDNQPLSLIVMEKWLKQLGFSEWVEIHALASKRKGKVIDTLLKYLKAKFEWIKTHAGKLGLPPLSELSAFRLSGAERREKEPLKCLRKCLGLVITELEAGIFYYNEIFDLRNTLEAEEMYKKMEFAIVASNDAAEARKIVKDNLDGFGM